MSAAPPNLDALAPTLEVAGLTVAIGGVNILDGVDFSLCCGQTLALVGESGCGKSMTALALMGLLPRAARVAAGSLRLEGRELVGLGESAWRDLRGRELAMIFQEPSGALDPLMTVGRQIMEAIQAHESMSQAQARQRALAMLEAVGIPEPALRLDQYPFELSGGMCQRIMIASALAGRPKVLIADEPTTALDVTIQAQILDLMRGLSRETGTAVVLITHDLGVVAEMADRVAVMYAGQVVEQADALEIFATARHPYTRMLLASIPRLDGEPKAELSVIPGVVPEARHWPRGCRFHSRCPRADQTCRDQPPRLTPVDDGDHLVACWHQDSPPEARS